MSACPICFDSYAEKSIGSLDTCDHLFCIECILLWSKTSNLCPVDREEFHVVNISYNGKNLGKIDVKFKKGKKVAERYDFSTHCEICLDEKIAGALVLCDACDLGYHQKCLDPPLFSIPSGAWYCPTCSPIIRCSSNQGEKGLEPEPLRRGRPRKNKQGIHSNFQPKPCVHQEVSEPSSSSSTIAKHSPKERNSEQISSKKSPVKTKSIKKEKVSSSHTKEKYNLRKSSISKQVSSLTPPLSREVKELLAVGSTLVKKKHLHKDAHENKVDHIHSKSFAARKVLVDPVPSLTSSVSVGKYSLRSCNSNRGWTSNIAQTDMKYPLRSHCIFKHAPIKRLPSPTFSEESTDSEESVDSYNHIKKSRMANEVITHPSTEQGSEELNAVSKEDDDDDELDLDVLFEEIATDISSLKGYSLLGTNSIDSALVKQEQSESTELLPETNINTSQTTSCIVQTLSETNITSKHQDDCYENAKHSLRECGTLKQLLTNSLPPELSRKAVLNADLIRESKIGNDEAILADPRAMTHSSTKHEPEKPDLLEQDDDELNIDDLFEEIATPISVRGYATSYVKADECDALPESKTIKASPSKNVISNYQSESDVVRQKNITSSLLDSNVDANDSSSDQLPVENSPSQSLGKPSTISDLKSSGNIFRNVEAVTHPVNGGHVELPKPEADLDEDKDSDLDDLIEEIAIDIDSAELSPSPKVESRSSSSATIRFVDSYKVAIKSDGLYII